MNQVQVIKTCLDLFCTSSGQKVNCDKTRVFFSKNVHWNVRNELSEALGFQRTDDLGKYLGVPVLHSRVSRHTFRYILDKARQRLSQWKARNLSMAGRVTLAKSVLQALPNYVMQTAWLPVETFNSLDQSCHSFVWGEDANTRKVHLLPWRSLCDKKVEGGLGLHMARDLNKSYMMKAGWELCTKHNSLWVQVVRHKYRCGDAMIPMIKELNSASKIWRGVCKNWDKVIGNLVWRVGTGDHVNFWNDPWVNTLGPLQDLAISAIPTHLLPFRVNQVVWPSGGWNLGIVANLLPDFVCRKIEAMHPPIPTNGADTIAWKGTTDGEFSLASAYDSLQDPPLVIGPQLYKILWRWKGPERVKMLLWRVAKETLMTNVARYRRGLASDASCPRCHTHPETTLHMVRDCAIAKNAWHGVQGTRYTATFFTSNLSSWLQENLNRGREDEEEWAVLFGAVIDTLWRT